MKKLFLALFLISQGSFSIELNLIQVACNLTNLSAEDCASLEDEARERLLEDLPDVSLQNYADGVADATAFSVQGQGSDYGENFENVMVDASVGLAVDGKLSQLEKNPEEADGVGLGTAITVGMNLENLNDSKWGPFVLSKLDIFISGAHYDIREKYDEVDTDGTLTSAGIFARYRLINEERLLKWHMLDWGGIHVHTGIQYSKIDLRAQQDFEGEVFRDGLLEGRFNGGYVRLDLDAHTWTLPVEISTYFRFAYLLTVYGGLGVDFVTGESNLDLSADGSASGGLTILSNDLQLSFNANRERDGEPRSTTFRQFVGLQLNLPYFRIYAHANKAFDSDLVGAHIGFKFVF